MQHRTAAITTLVVIGFCVAGRLGAEERILTFDLHTRDAQSSARRVGQAKIDPAKTGVVVIDPWNFHWCMTATQRVDAMVPRWNRVLECARGLGMHASVRFHVFIDGKLAAESPVMRISQAPWRFDVKIPAGARRINLVTTDAGSRSAYDLGNWCNAGFVRAAPEKADHP